MTIQKKAIMFTTDALIAISLMVIAAAIVFSQDATRIPYKHAFEQANVISEDSVKILSSIEFSSVNETLRDAIISDTNITAVEYDKDLIYIIGALWAENSTTSMSYARQLTQAYIGALIPTGYSYGLFIDDEEIYSDPKEDYEVLSASKRMISGIHEGLPTKGTSTRVSISNILSKNTAKFIYFGGFVGEGNITKTFMLPDAIGSVIRVYIEMDAGSNFTMSVNENFAGTYTMTSMVPMYANNWTMHPSYYSLFNPRENTIQINFTDAQNSYIGGGYIKVAYNTSQMDTTMIDLDNGNVSDRYSFPGINGFINLYSSFYVPGTLNSMRIYLHLFNPYTTFLYIGNTRVYQNQTNQTQHIYINDTTLSSMLSYASMSEATIPIRFGVKNMTGLGFGSDVVLITDLSGSMRWRMDNNNMGTQRTCSDPLLSNPSTARISVANCSDKAFVDTILNNEDQRVGLIGYGTSTDNSRTVYLTEDNATLKAMIEGYDGDQSATCISCGIASATDMLLTTINVTTIVNNATTWYYNDSYRGVEPPDDSFGHRWYEPNYTLESEWSAGNAVFGAGAGSIPVTTALATGGVSGNITYADLWDDNRTTIPVSFETGYNSTGNTYGWGGANDGWEHDTHNNNGPYGWDDEIIYRNVVGEKLEFETGNGNNNNCWTGWGRRYCSGGYGVQFQITQEQMDIINNNGGALFSFDYEWDGNDNPFEGSDQVWIKGRFTDSTGTSHWLGHNLDGIHNNGDSDPEIYAEDNPNDEFSGVFVQDITGWFTGIGTYYLDFGGKLRASASDEYGTFRFDNILIEIKNGTETYYFRKNFTVDDMNKVGRGFLKVVSSDMANIYLNGQSIDVDPGPSHDAVYWNRIELIDRSYFRQGNNVIAAKLYNTVGSTRFDLRLEALNESRNKAMLVMSDGEANRCDSPLASNCGTSAAKQQAIDFACYAYENYGILSHAVGFGSGADGTTLGAIADCGRGMYRSSNNADELKQIYQDIANAMISYTTQRSNITGAYTITTLYPDSYIEYNYTPSVDLDYGEISLTFDSLTFGETSGNPGVESPKNGSYWIPPSVEVIDAKATSYSSEFWTSILNMRNETSGWVNVYNLSTYGDDFTKFGDPYIVFMPVSLIGQNQTNYVQINTGTNETYFTGGSPDSKVIYTIKLKGIASYGEISPKADGCEWIVEQYNGNNATIKIPSDYNGTKTCEFSSTQIVYDHDDSIDNAAILLLQQLDVTDDNRIDIAIDQTNINIRIIKVTDIPWMWGPAILKLEIWK